MSDHTWLILGYILVISCYDVNRFPMNHRNFDFFHSVHNFVCFECVNNLLKFNTAKFIDQGYGCYTNVYRRII